jgi:hypothetical protein
MGVTPLNIGFRRALSENRWDRWVHLVTRIMGVQLFENSNIFQWHLTESDQFSVKFMYLDLVHGPIGDFKKYLEDQSFTKNQNFYVVPSQ